MTINANNMTEEVKPAEEAVKVEQPTEEQKPEESKSEEDASNKPAEEQQEESVDYEALYQEEKTRREKAEHKIVKMRAKDLAEEKEEETEEGEEDIKAYVDKRLSQVILQTQEEKYDAEINKVSSNEGEKKLIKLFLEDNNFSGSIEEKVQKAKALANYKKVAEVAKELSHKLTKNVGTPDSSSYKPKAQKVVTGLTEADVTFLKKRGLYDEYVKKYGK